MTFMPSLAFSYEVQRAKDCIFGLYRPACDDQPVNFYVGNG